MRLFSMTVLAVLMSGLLGCSVPGVDAKNGAEDIPIPPGQGQLILKWKAEDRALLGSSWASSVADAYELVLMGSGGTRSVPLDSGSGPSGVCRPGNLPRHGARRYQTIVRIKHGLPGGFVDRRGCRRDAGPADRSQPGDEVGRPRSG